MFQDVGASISWALGLGLDNKDINVWQMSLRAIIVFVIAIGLIRLANKRFMGKYSAIDVLLGIIIGSIVSRAITGNAPFFPALAASLVLVLLHRTVSAIAFRSHLFSTMVKGHERTLIRDGELQWHEMRRSHITEHDVHEAMRNSGTAPDVRSVKSGHLERNGDISIILRNDNEAT